MFFRPNSVHQKLLEKGYLQRDSRLEKYADGTDRVREEKADPPDWFHGKASGKPHSFYVSRVRHPDFDQEIPIVVGSIGEPGHETHHVIAVLSPDLTDPHFPGRIHPHYRLTYAGRLKLSEAFAASNLENLDSTGRQYVRKQKGHNPFSES